MIGNEEVNAIRRIMKKPLSGYKGSWNEWFFGGDEVKALEAEWAEYFGVKHAIAFNSATSGLWAALATVLQKNYTDIIQSTERYNGKYLPDEVIVTPYSMTCSASLPLLFGAKSVFADIEPQYYCLDVNSIRQKITGQTKAILIVDLFGMPYDADAINALAKQHGIVVIEDAAQAAGAKYKGKYAGTLGDIGVYSLNIHKHIQCGEGGIAVTNNDETAMKLRLYMNHAEAVNNDINRSEYISMVGMNLRMTEMQAAIAREQLKRLAGIIEQYQEYAKDFTIPMRPGCTSAYYKFASMDMPKNPNSDRYNMKEHYITPIYQMPLFRSLGYAQNLCPVCEAVDRNIKLAWLKEVL
jgi:perosamine synthetase